MLNAVDLAVLLMNHFDSFWKFLFNSNTIVKQMIFIIVALLLIYYEAKFIEKNI